MSEPKTRPTDASVDDFIDLLKSEQQRDEARAICKMMASTTKKPAVMWGPAIIGFGTYKLVYSSGKTLEWPMLAFSPRKQNMTVYIIPGFKEYKPLLKKLGKHKTSVTCLYFNSLTDLHIPTLKKIIVVTYKYMKRKYG